MNDKMGSKMKKISLVILMTLAFGLTTQSEMRTWTDTKGNTVEAEFVKIITGKVVLRKADGKQIKVPASGLCSADKKYLENAVPPEIEIKVDIDREKKKLADFDGYVQKREKIKGNVIITKKNREACAKTYTAYLYIIGKDMDDDEFLIVDKSDHSFSFKTKTKIEFSGAQSKIEYDEHYNSSYNDGTEYEGYLVVITNETGQIICTKGSRSLFEKKAGQILKAKKSDRLPRLERDL